MSSLVAFLAALPWTCEASAPSTMNGLRTEVLSVCRPHGAPKLEGFVQRVADAMGNAGHPPRLRFGPHGPHLVSVRGKDMISVSFVTQGSTFSAWVAVQRFGAPVSPLPELPPGTEVLTDHEEDTGKRMLSLRLSYGSSENLQQLDQTFRTLGAQALSQMSEGTGLSGRLLWNGRAGFYHVTDAEPHVSYLTLYAEPRRAQ